MNYQIWYCNSLSLFFFLSKALTRLETDGTAERGIWATLARNEARLVTPFDLFLTLKHAVALWGRPLRDSRYTDKYNETAPLWCVFHGSNFGGGDQQGGDTGDAGNTGGVDSASGINGRDGGTAKRSVEEVQEQEEGVFEFEQVTPAHQAQSVFTQISASRSCDEAGIPRHHCSHGGVWSPLHTFTHGPGRGGKTTAVDVGGGGGDGGGGSETGSIVWVIEKVSSRSWVFITLQACTLLWVD